MENTINAIKFIFILYVLFCIFVCTEEFTETN